MSPIFRWLFRYILVFIKKLFPHKRLYSSITGERNDLKIKYKHKTVIYQIITHNSLMLVSSCWYCYFKTKEPWWRLNHYFIKIKVKKEEKHSKLTICISHFNVMWFKTADILNTQIKLYKQITNSILASVLPLAHL